MPATLGRFQAAGRFVLALVLALAATGGAWARNDKFMLPIEPALRQPSVRQTLGTDVVLRFGSASDVSGPGALPPMEVESKADPFAPNPNANPGSYRLRRTDEQVCLDAFRKALILLQDQARQRGANAVVGIVSNYDNTVFDSREVYECHVGLSRGVVALRGRAARADAVASARAASPSVPASPAAVTPPAPPAANAPEPQRLASGFALIDDLDAIPYLSDRGREEYAKWLTYPTPRAFAIADNGYFWQAAGLQPKDPALPTDPVERALLGCEAAAKRPCKLYAVNRAVVWRREPR